ncbi:EAL domain-containing protein, partial [Vibrio fortis]
IDNSSISNPKSAREVEESFKSHFNEEFSLYALKNTIASVRKKYRNLLKKAGIDSQSELISNLYKVGYFIDLDKAPINQEQSRLDINQFKPSYITVLKMLARTYYKEWFKGTVIVLSTSSLILFVVYFFQILYTTKIADQFSENTKIVTEELKNYGCNNDDAVYALRHSLNLDSAVMTTPDGSCYISTTRSKSVNPDNIGEFYDSLDFTYSGFTYPKENIFLTVRIPKRSIEARYRNSLMPLFVDSVSIQKHGNIILHNNENHPPLYDHLLATGATISFYSHNITWIWLTLTLLFTVLLYHRYLIGVVVYMLRWRRISFEEEPIINTEDNSVLYYELLSRVRDVGVLDFINAMRRSNLLTFHTILMIEAVRVAKNNNSHDKYGV